MADTSLKDFLLDQLGSLPEVRAKPMFGGYGLYQGKRFFGILYAGRVYFKTNAKLAKECRKRGLAPFTYEKGRQIVSQTYFEVPSEVLENRDDLLAWARRAIAIATKDKLKPPDRRQAKPVTCEICILAGGLSQRMGQQKAAMRLGGKTMLERIEQTARQTGLPVRVIRRDSVPRCGPLGGIATALRKTGKEAVLFLACDMPFITVDMLRRLARGIDRREALFMRTQDGIGFPFILHRAVLGQVEDQIARGELSIQRLAEVLNPKVVRLPKALAGQLRNINTPREMDRARRSMERPSVEGEP